MEAFKLEPQSEKHLLVVDDDPATLEAVGTVLRDVGYSVSTAAGGASGLEYLGARGRRPDLVLLDLMMPDVDGWDFTARVRSDASLRDLPIVVMTAGGTSMLATAPVAAGYLTKPLKLDELLNTIERTLTMRGARGPKQSPASE